MIVFVMPGIYIGLLVFSAYYVISKFADLAVSIIPGNWAIKYIVTISSMFFILGFGSWHFYSNVVFGELARYEGNNPEYRGWLKFSPEYFSITEFGNQILEDLELGAKNHQTCFEKVFSPTELKISCLRKNGFVATARYLEKKEKYLGVVRWRIEEALILKEFGYLSPISVLSAAFLSENMQTPYTRAPIGLAAMGKIVVMNQEKISGAAHGAPIFIGIWIALFFFLMQAVRNQI